MNKECVDVECVQCVWMLNVYSVYGCVMCAVCMDVGCVQCVWMWDVYSVYGC